MQQAQADKHGKEQRQIAGNSYRNRDAATDHPARQRGKKAKSKLRCWMPAFQQDLDTAVDLLMTGSQCRGFGILLVLPALGEGEKMSCSHQEEANPQLLSISQLLVLKWNQIGIDNEKRWREISERDGKRGRRRQKEKRDSGKRREQRNDEKWEKKLKWRSNDLRKEMRRELFIDQSEKTQESKPGFELSFRTGETVEFMKMLKVSLLYSLQYSIHLIYIGTKTPGSFLTLTKIIFSIYKNGKKN